MSQGINVAIVGLGFGANLSLYQRHQYKHVRDLSANSEAGTDWQHLWRGKALHQL
jgi:hypothetical protein